MKTCFKLALRSLLYRKKQYASLFAVCVFGTAVSLFCLFLMNGMLLALNEKAKLYYGGDFQFIGGHNSLRFDRVTPFVQKIEGIFKDEAVVSSRLDFEASSSALYFEGTGVRQRVIKGIDFSKEQPLFDRVNYVSGSAENMAGSTGILLSEPIARMLCVSLGDTVTLMVRSSRGYINTEELLVQGIFRDSSLFGMYTSYMDINVLRKVLGFHPDFANRICINLGGKTADRKQVIAWYSELSGQFNMFPIVPDKQLFYDPLLTNQFDRQTYAFVPLDANLKDVRLLINAMKCICYFIIIMLVVIVTVGLGSTYRILVMKRINEIGIYMSLGMRRADILRTFLFEALLLVVFGALTGLLVAFALCRLSGLIDFSFIPAFDIFLVNGTLLPKASFFTACNLIAILLVCTISAVFVSVRSSVRIMPVQALTVTE